jgi:hypothetical protein
MVWGAFAVSITHDPAVLARVSSTAATAVVVLD